MTRPISTSLPAGALLIAAVLAVSGCQSGMTYGTGTSPGMQTVQDIVGISVLSNEQQEPISYRPRPPIVAPPTVAELPPPRDSTAQVAAVNWPVDPDLQAKQLRDEIARREAAGEALPTFTLPAGAKPVQTAAATQGPMTAEEMAALRQRFADARGTVAVDANGNPVRRYLTDPPSEYRVPDAEAPTQLAEMPKKKRKFLWWTWEQTPN